LLPQLSATPGVSSATELIGLPLLFSPQGDVTIPGKPHHEVWMTKLEMCSEQYFQTLGQHLLQGRLLTADDMAGERKVAVVNESLVRKYFGGENPLGRVIKFNVLDEIPDTPRDAYFEIVGVVNDTRGFDFEGDTAIPRPADKAVPEAFLPYSISGFGNRAIAMQTRIPPAFLANHVRQLVWSLDHDVVLVEPHVGQGVGFSLDQLMQGLVYGKQEFAAMTFGACAFLGLVLALLGLFSVMTYIVSLQTHDIGIRLALGAPHNAILRMVLQRGMGLILVGVGLGLVVSLLVTRFLSSQFRGISPRDPLTLALVIAAILAAGLSACLLPARRATRVDPMVTLRYE
jgi:putative ABC transport system permease protein